MQVLTKDDRKALKEQAGVKYAKVLRSRGTDRLIEAQDDDGFKFRRWWYDGESAADIRWETESKDGWSQSVTAIDELHDLAMERPITLTEAHEFFPAVGRSTLNEWARMGKIQAHRSGKIWITTRAAIEAALKE
jgi:hypothetical protein